RRQKKRRRTRQLTHHRRLRRRRNPHVRFAKSSSKEIRGRLLLVRVWPEFVGQPFRLPTLNPISDAFALQRPTQNGKILLMEKRLRFPKSRRLTRDLEFRRVRMEGKSIRGDMLTIGFLKSAQPNATARAGFVTSKRVGNAVIRN